MENLINQSDLRILENLSRKIIFSMLQNLSGVGLTLMDCEGTYTFGDKLARLQADIEINDYRFYTRLLIGGSIGAAESYVEGEWNSNDLLSVIRIFARNQATLSRLENRLSWLRYPIHKLNHWLNRNTRSGSRSNIAAHYDLGNDLYKLFLDPHMQYSSAIFSEQHSTLEHAQENKLKLLCQKLDLKADDHVIEIGTGWGGLACYMAKNYGCKVTTTTLSRQQYEYAQQLVRQSGLQDRITLLLKDYRDLDGRFDKLVSVEMIEAVGYQYLPGYFQQLEQLLKPNGRMLIQSITIADQQFDHYKKGVDFIQRYIFPGGCLPSLTEMCHQLSDQTSMTVNQVNTYGIDYAKTLAIWAQRFKRSSSQLQELGYDADFSRLWDFYFAYCEAGFREACINLIHFEAVKPGK